MDQLVVLAILLALAYWMFRHGKRIGSRAGYTVGRQGRSSRRR